MDLAEDPSFVFDEPCRTDALKQVCNRYSCIREGEIFGEVRPRGCKRQDCLSMTCDRVMQGDSTFRGGFRVDRTFEDSSFAGRLRVRDTFADTICSPIFDDGSCISKLSDYPAVDLLRLCEPLFCGFKDTTRDPPIAADFFLGGPGEEGEPVDCETFNRTDSTVVLFNPLRIITNNGEFPLFCGL